MPPYGVELAGHHHRVNVALGNLWQEGAGSLLPGRIVLPVMQRGQPEELVGPLLWGLQRSADLLAMWGPAVPVDELEMMHDPWPAGKAVAARDHQLGVGEGLDRMELAGQRDRIAVTGADSAQQALGLLAQVVQVRVVGKSSGRHRPASSLRACCPRRQARKEVWKPRTNSLLQVG